MGKKLKTKEEALKTASNSQIAQLAFDAATWYKAAFLQAIRFSETVKIDIGDPFRLPWRDNNDFPSKVDRVFFLFAIDHTLTNIKDLNTALQARNDNRLEILKAVLLDADNFQKRIHQLRNENEHNIEYSMKIGNQQDNFQHKISTSIGEIEINSHWNIQFEQDVYFGDVKLMDILEHMQKIRDEIIPLLEKIAYEYLGGTHGKNENGNA